MPKESRRREWNLDTMSLEELADFQSEKSPDHGFHQVAATEFLYRQTKAIEEGARAARETAEHTKRYTVYSFLAVVAMFLALVLSLVRGCSPAKESAPRVPADQASASDASTS